MTRHDKAVELIGKKLALFPGSSPPALAVNGEGVQLSKVDKVDLR